MSYGAYFRKLWSHEEIPKKFPGGRTGVIVGCLIVHFGGKVKSKFRKGIGMAMIMGADVGAAAGTPPPPINSVRRRRR